MRPGAHKIERRTNMRLGIGSYTYAWAIGVPGYPPPPHPLTPPALLDKAAELGVRVVQFADNMPLERLSAGELKAVAKQAAQYKIEVELGAQGIAPAYLRKQLRLADRLQATLLRLVMDTDRFRASPEEAVQHLGPLMPEFERAGVRLAVESHDRFKAATLLNVLEQLDNGCAGVCLDTANSFGCSEGPDTVLETLGWRVFNLHLKDYVIRRLTHCKGFLIEGCPAGQGQLDIPHLLDRLREMGRDPNVVLELWQGPEPSAGETKAKEEAWAAQSVTFLRRYISE
jgi:3-oxoisoapionate decarboxylase